VNLNLVLLQPKQVGPVEIHGLQSEEDVKFGVNEPPGSLPRPPAKVVAPDRADVTAPRRQQNPEDNVRAHGRTTRCGCCIRPPVSLIPLAAFETPGTEDSLYRPHNPHRRR
jgi:hypothetical protein